MEVLGGSFGMLPLMLAVLGTDYNRGGSRIPIKD